ncbi:hypothetical protein [Streptomyces echinatus]|uniref:Uncharacterized protein n=1 Tax=Streptomyces echinatus TaxID=67293 RepID=A0A7W9Q1I8_9ACTN|nr:hypothetical protein [Streptomyces echinatus]MBB5931909.1 hypothetical protein [Streptomyces echinatus]
MTDEVVQPDVMMGVVVDVAWGSAGRWRHLPAPNAWAWTPVAQVLLLGE